jgi:hypothetical protein
MSPYLLDFIKQDKEYFVSSSFTWPAGLMVRRCFPETDFGKDYGFEVICSLWTFSYLKY